MTHDQQSKSELAQRYGRGVEIKAEIDEAIFDEMARSSGDFFSGTISKSKEARIRREVIEQIAEEDVVFPADVRADYKLAEAIGTIAMFGGKCAEEFLLCDKVTVEPKQIFRLARLDPDQMKIELAKMQQDAGFVSNASTPHCDEEEAVEESRDRDSEEE